MLGEMGWEPTAPCYRLADELVRDRRGGLASADLLLPTVRLHVQAAVDAALARRPAPVPAVPRLLGGAR